jgi:hypothetical protein
MTISLAIYIYLLARAKVSTTIPGLVVVFCIATDAILLAYLAAKTT